MKTDEALTIDMTVLTPDLKISCYDWKNPSNVSLIEKYAAIESDKDLKKSRILFDFKQEYAFNDDLKFSYNRIDCNISNVEFQKLVDLKKNLIAVCVPLNPSRVYFDVMRKKDDPLNFKEEKTIYYCMDSPSLKNGFLIGRLIGKFNHVKKNELIFGGTSFEYLEKRTIESKSDYNFEEKGRIIEYKGKPETIVTLMERK